MHALRLVGLFLVAAIGLANAQVPLIKEPHHRVTYANPQLRILDVNVPPGATAQDHLHEFDIATVSMTDGAETRLQTAGQPWGPVRPRRPLGDAVVTDYTGKPASHLMENVGKTAYQLFAVENLRAKGWSTAPAMTAPATKLTTESRSFRIYDVRLGPGMSSSAHTHAVPTIAVLISGKVLSEGPDAQAKALAPAPVGLKQLDQPGQWLLVPGGDRHQIVRLGTGETRLVEIEVR